MMLLEGRSQLVGTGRLRHLRQRSENLLFGVIDILQRIEEEVVEVFVFRGHVALRLARADRGRSGSQRHLTCNVPAMAKGRTLARFGSPITSLPGIETVACSGLA